MSKNAGYFMQVMGPPDVCVRHGKDHMAVMLNQRSGIFVVGGVPQNEGEPSYVCVACLHEQIPADPAARNRARALLWKVAERHGLLHHHSSCCVVGEDGKVEITAESCICADLEREVQAELEGGGAKEEACFGPPQTTEKSMGCPDFRPKQAQREVDVAHARALSTEVEDRLAQVRAQLEQGYKATEAAADLLDLLEEALRADPGETKRAVEKPWDPPVVGNVDTVALKAEKTLVGCPACEDYAFEVYLSTAPGSYVAIRCPKCWAKGWARRGESGMLEVVGE